MEIWDRKTQIFISGKSKITTKKSIMKWKVNLFHVHQLNTSIVLRGENFSALFRLVIGHLYDSFTLHVETPTLEPFIKSYDLDRILKRDMQPLNPWFSPHIFETVEKSGTEPM